MENKFIVNSFESITNPLGDIYKIINHNSKNYIGFQELYITSIKKNKIKAWKNHLLMQSNLIVIKGKVKFVFVINDNNFETITISELDHQYLTIFPKTIFGFQCIDSPVSKIMNFSNLLHDKNESINYDIQKFKYDW